MESASPKKKTEAEAARKEILEKETAKEVTTPAEATKEKKKSKKDSKRKRERSFCRLQRAF